MSEVTHVLPHAQRAASTLLPTRHGTFAMLGYHVDGTELVALAVGLDEPPVDVLPWVRIHSECLTGDAFGSLRCDCGEQLQAALAAIMDHGYGAVIYARGHEGRGIGLIEKLKAYALQDAGYDTLDANLALGHPGDARRYDQAAAVLADLGLTKIALLSSNPTKQEALEDFGIEVAQRLRLGVPDRPENVFYLNTKRARMRHDSPPTEVIPATDAWGGPAEVYDALAAEGPQLVIAQLGQSLDGFIASRTGDAGPVTGSEDHVHLHRLRSLVDAVVVGAATVIADDCRLTVREVPGRNPVRVVVDPQARVPLEASVLSNPEARTLWLVGASAPADLAAAGHVKIVRMPTDGPFAPSDIVRVLLDRGLGRVLVEGGGRLVSSFVEAGSLDRLFVTVAPILLGEGVPGIRFDGADRVADARRGRPRSFKLGNDVCVELNLRAPV
ncbi:GTP cyclohydrolase II RibA [Propioniciclava tarda]|uniref:GTP cyclohydrolase II n=1 Tax=Propioniciclava tarda TaxID=433330 RepID=A0A4Q9KNS5_PROTD|nr:GTP cyclohydrolase II RibA [Propioniciclava tarda]TBT96222.1 GTP cyclohydrolase II RibA [Propioniciclava tarda]SMO33809.1 3,4-dihydroxy 2-butanone 4-phosphate synthase / GTP cyclohydrolase II [Propioniciclava tarda]HOA88526.1 GTP cyclohydrolase II RibA [Propioniciclava tarda]